MGKAAANWRRRKVELARLRGLTVAMMARYKFELKVGQLCSQFSFVSFVCVAYGKTAQRDVGFVAGMAAAGATQTDMTWKDHLF